MWLTEKWKKFRETLKRNKEIYSIYNLTSDYNFIPLNKLSQITDTIFITKHNNDLILLVKKTNWNKYMGIHRTWLCDSQGNDFTHDNLYEAIFIEGRKISMGISYPSRVPKEIINEMYDELIKNKTVIIDFLKQKVKEIYYKNN